MKVIATYHGGYAATVHARHHTIAVDEPEASGGEDLGAMPTELLAASLASCFALALGHVARKRERDLPGLTVTVEGERPGRELRYGRLTVTAAADVPIDELDALIERARRFCWVSNTFADPPHIEYRSAPEVP
jgi:putative redox protein